MRTYLLLIYFFLGFHPCWSQQSFSWDKLHGSLGLSILNGQSGVDGRLGLEAGYDLFAQYTLNIGTAIDYYFMRSAPVYIEVQRAWGNKPRHFFAYAGGGLNLPWPMAEDQSIGGGWGMVSTVSHQTGIYSQLGVGRTLGKVRERGFVLRLGHSFKSYIESYTERVWTGSEWGEALRKNRYALGRIDLTLQFKL